MSTTDLGRYGRYELRDVLGTGAMGTVYRAWDPELGRAVAVKVVQGWELTDHNLARFRREAQVLARLPHPHIVSIYDVGTADGAPFVVMELVEGRSLADLLADGCAVPFENKVRAIAEICDALACAHGAGVVHRDVKPANILIAQDGGAKLADFGIAYLNGSALTATSSVLGTPAYLAPEALGPGPTDARVDIYGAAACLYEWLCGSRPYTADSLQVLLARIRDTDPPPLSDRWLDCPPSLERCVHRGLARDPAGRYQRAVEFATALREFLGDAVASPTAGLHVTARDVPAADDSGQVGSASAPSRRPLPVALGVVVMMLLSIGGTIWNRSSEPAAGTAPSAVVGDAPETASPTSPPDTATDLTASPVSRKDQGDTRSEPSQQPASGIGQVPAVEAHQPPVVLESEPDPPPYLPIGTPVRVLLTTELRTDRARLGHEFEGVLAEPLLWHGEVVAKVGTPIKGVVDAVSAGGGGRPPSLQLSLLDIVLRNAPVPLRTARYEVVAPSAGDGGAPVTTLIVAAAAGAALGGALDGGRGALAGAAAAVAAADRLDAAPRPGEVVLSNPLTFRLSAPFQLGEPPD